MSYAAHNANGCIGDAGTITGWADLRQWAEGYLDADSELLHLINNGWSENIERLKQELVEANPSDASVRSTLANLLALCDKSDGMLIISDGTGE